MAALMPNFRYRQTAEGPGERIVVDVLKSFDHGFGAQPVPDSILPRPAFAFFGIWTGASERVTAVGFDLSERGHGMVGPSAMIDACPFESAGRGSSPICRGCEIGFWAAVDRRGCAIEPGVPPQPICNRQRIDLDLVPPCSLVALPVQFAVMEAAHRDGELVADLAAERPRLGKTQMVSIDWRAA